MRPTRRRMLPGSNSEVFVANADGSDARNLSNSPAFDGWPAWSPDDRQIAFKPDWAKGKSAPFKRNDAMLEALPIGVLVTPGSGIQANLADKARHLGIPVWKIGEDGA